LEQEISKERSMPRVVIDTNVIISSGIAMDGNPADIFEMLLEKKIINFTSLDIIDEIEQVFSRPKIRSCIDPGFIVQKFKRLSVIIKIISSINIIRDDPADNKFLECALDSGADYIISGDRHLLDLKEFKGIKIVSPSDFLKLPK